MEAQAPSTARMIDYWLGGEHHFAVDVAAARAFEQAYGPVAQEFRELRAFLGRVVRRMAEHGIDEYLVVGAGVPTQGNVHQAVSPARVLYVDLDPANVALGQEILAGEPHTAYALGDATDLASIDPVVMHGTLPGWGVRPVGVVFLGLAAFIEDTTLADTLDRFVDVTAPGSMLAFDFDTEVLAAHPQALELMGPAFRMRPPAAFADLLGRWTLTEEGMAPVAHWGRRDVDRPVAGTAPAAFYGGLAVHRD